MLLDSEGAEENACSVEIGNWFEKKTSLLVFERASSEKIVNQIEFGHSHLVLRSSTWRANKKQQRRSLGSHAAASVRVTLRSRGSYGVPSSENPLLLCRQPSKLRCHGMAANDLASRHTATYVMLMNGALAALFPLPQSKTMPPFSLCRPFPSATIKGNADVSSHAESKFSSQGPLKV